MPQALGVPDSRNQPRFANICRNFMVPAHRRANVFDTYNGSAKKVFERMQQRADALRISPHRLNGRDIVLDCGIDQAGSLEAGIELARLCMADRAQIELQMSNLLGGIPAVQVRTDQPVVACLGCQYAGWPLQAGKYFAMGSGPMRLCRGREKVLQHLGLHEDAHSSVVGVLETGVLPTAEIIELVRQDCQLTDQTVMLAVAPTTSIAGTIQVVARSVETSMHKLEESGFDVRCIQSGMGIAPLPPPATKTIAAIGRTNDAILYGAHVTLWVDADPELIEQYGPQVPSSSSRDYGRPFAEIFKDYDCDFYKIDPLLFSPAKITFVNLRNGVARSFGQLAPDILEKSFS
jgi:methenyltetrahydromethanopterin cyclohydrolase